MKAASHDGTVKDFLVSAGVLGLLERTGLKASLGLAWRCVRSPGTIRHELDVLRDYWSFKQRYGSFLGEGAHLADPAKKVLIVSLTDWAAQVKAESMLAKALQLHGYTPIVVTFRGCRRALKYFRVFGFDQFVFLDDFMSLRAAPSGDGDFRALLDEVTTVRSLLGLEYRDVDIGRHALSSVTRALLHGSVELSDPTVTTFVERALRRSVGVAHAAEALVDTVQPQMALFLEKGYTPYGEIFDILVNRKVNTIQWFHSHRSDALAFKRYTGETRDVHPFSLSLETWERIRRMPWTNKHERELMEELRGRYEGGTWFNRKFLQVGKKLKHPEEVRRQLGLDSFKKTAVIFSHVLWDATFFYGENLFNDYEEWLVETIRAACMNSAVNWVVKLHPDYVWKLRLANRREEIRDEVAIQAKIGTLPDHIKLLEPATDISTFSLFAVTDYCVTVRGTIGIEMPCFGIPVFTAGTGRYSGFGFTIDSSTREEYLDKLRCIQDFPRLSVEQTELAKKHAYALFKLRPCAFKTFEMVQMSLENLGHPLDHNIIIHAHSFHDLTAAQDLKAFTEWAIDSWQLDFLMPYPNDYEPSGQSALCTE